MSLPEIINGWFSVAFARDVPPRALRVISFMGHTVVLFRTASGRLAAVSAPCSHFETSFERVGAVVGEELCCPDHGLNVDVWGVCRESVRGRAASTRALSCWSFQERMGAIFMWHHHEGKAPIWQLPKWEEAGWGDTRPTMFTIRSHPQDVLENGVDLGHFYSIHGAADVEKGQLSTERHQLTLNTSFTTPARMFASANEHVRVNLRCDAYGLGLGVIESYVSGFEARMRSFVAPTPVGNGKIEIRCWMTMHEPGAIGARLPLVGKLLPRGLVKVVMERLMHEVFVYDFGKDLRYLDGRRYLTRPALGKRDVYIGPYRKWARQFYPAAMLQRALPPTKVA